MPKKFDIESLTTGLVLVSPTGYYTGPELEQFLEDLFDARLKNIAPNSSSPFKIDINFLVGGPLYGLDQYQFKGKKIERVIHSAKQAHEEGQIKTIRWFNQNCQAIFRTAKECIRKKFDLKNVQIKLIDPDGVDQYPDVSGHDSNTNAPHTFTINITQWNQLWKDKEEKFAKELGELVAYFAMGHQQITSMLSSNQKDALGKYGLAAAQITSLEQNYIDLSKVNPFSDEENKFLCEALKLPYNSFQEGYAATLSKNVTSSKPKHVFSHAVLAANIFLDRQIEKSKFDKKTLLQESISVVFRPFLQFFIAEMCSFKDLPRFENKSQDGLLIYLKINDSILSYMINAVLHIYEIQLKFPARYVKSTDNNNNIANNSSILLPRDNNDNGSSNIEDKLLTDINYTLQMTIYLALRFSNNVLAILQLLQKLMDWYRLVLIKISCCSLEKRKEFLALESDFISSITSILDNLNQKSLAKEKELPIWLTAWQNEIKAMVHKTATDKPAIDFQDHCFALLKLSSSENAKTLSKIVTTPDQEFSKSLDTTNNTINRFEDNFPPVHDKDFGSTKILYKALILNTARLADKVKEKSETEFHFKIGNN